MGDRELNKAPKVTDMAYVPVVMADGSIGQIAKADLASVVAGQNGIIYKDIVSSYENYKADLQSFFRSLDEGTKFFLLVRHGNITLVVGYKATSSYGAACAFDYEGTATTFKPLFSFYAENFVWSEE